MSYRNQSYIEQLHPRLQRICDLLSDVDMTKDDVDLIACSFCNPDLKRHVYIYLDPEKPDSCPMKYDFEDELSDSAEYDKAVERGVVEDETSFLKKVYDFLQIDT